MPAKKGPVILVLLLLFLLVFIGGIRYGQHVELQNKKTLVMLSLTPPPKPSVLPEAMKKVTFISYSSKSCGVSFLYPSTVTLAKESTDEARFTQSETVALSMSCKKSVSLPSDMKKVTTSEAVFQKKTIKVQAYNAGTTRLIFFSIQNPVNGKIVNFLLDKDLYKLLESSFQFN